MSIRATTRRVRTSGTNTWSPCIHCPADAGRHDRLVFRSIAETGFTLIELVVVIVILGILAGVALPKFVDLSAEADNAAAKSVAGALASASQLNFAKYIVAGRSDPAVWPINWDSTCSELKTHLMPNLDTTQFTIPEATLACPHFAVGVGYVDTTCSVKSHNGAAQTISITCTGYDGL